MSAHDEARTDIDILNALPNDAFKQEWITALRSGEYTQGKGRLRVIFDQPDDPNVKLTKDCCLGVACDILVKHGIGRWQGAVSEDRGYVQAFVLTVPWQDNYSETNLVQREVKRLFGIAPRSSGVLSLTDNVPTAEGLAQANDHGATFIEIADALESRDYQLLWKLIESMQ